MTNPAAKPPGGWLITATVALVFLAAIAPLLIQLSRALLPLVIGLTVAAIALRLVFFHTRRW